MQFASEIVTADGVYCRLLSETMDRGALIDSRNGLVKSCIDFPLFRFATFPLVTMRKTAWRLALREMEWFLSGDERCPQELERWWEGQLHPSGRYINGYSHQLRRFATGHDQVAAFIEGLRAHPNSRRLIMTTWNPMEMATISHVNENAACPTTCHGTIVQGFVRDDCLSLTVYQRSADLLVGVPHNWVQWWGFLLWAAVQAGLGVGFLGWVFGDAHIYQHPTHLAAVKDILSDRATTEDITLCYDLHPGRPFLANDFSLIGDIPPPVTMAKPIRL